MDLCIRHVCMHADGHVLDMCNGTVGKKLLADFALAKCRRVYTPCRRRVYTPCRRRCRSASHAQMPCTMSHASIDSEMRTLPEDLVRLSVGIEDVDDLIDDLIQANRANIVVVNGPTLLHTVHGVV